MKNMIVLTDNLLLPRMDLQESPITSSDFIFFTDGSYLRGPHGKYQLCTGTSYVAVSPVPILENGPLPNISSAISFGDSTKAYLPNLKKY